MMPSNVGKLEFLTPQNSVLALIDFQPSMLRGVASGNKSRIKTAASALRKPPKS
jgi:hypothetical protein